MKENRQDCLSRSIRAGGIRSVIKETLSGRPTKKDAKRRGSVRKHLCERIGVV